MAFAISFKSESGDDYLYAYDGLPTLEIILERFSDWDEFAFFNIVEIDSNGSEDYINLIRNEINKAIKDKQEEIGY